MYMECMSLFPPKDVDRARAMGDLVYTNPFLPERAELEARALGASAPRALWTPDPNVPLPDPVLERLRSGAEALIAEARRRLSRGARPRDDRERRTFEDLVYYVLYYRYDDALYRAITEPAQGDPVARLFPDFAADLSALTGDTDLSPRPEEAPHVFALCFQIRRAFHFTFRHILGGSMPAARLRAAVWESIFTHDLRRYRRALYDRMHAVSTLILGPSGTGKELVASAIGLSRYIPFDPRRRAFAVDWQSSLRSLHIAALSPTLIESELFGHVKGAFTGAVQDRAGWLEGCTPQHTVFLDEIGELDPAIQVKLLRVLQNGTFQRLGESRQHTFEGRIVAATHRDLSADMAAGRFRDDLYYRLCSDLVRTPSLAEQIAGDPAELETLVSILVERILGASDAGLVADVLEVIAKNVGPDYAWPGNMRELEQCVRNVLVRRSYRPPAPKAGDVGGLLAREVGGAELSLDDLIARYCALAYHRTGSWVAAAERLGVDRRTVRARADLDFLGRLDG
jgi:hypothetical protein